jgi:serine O-acetyltransferase
MLDARSHTVLAALEASYDEPGPLNDLAAVALPNRRAVVEAFRALQHLLFLPFFHMGAVKRSELRGVLAGHLERATELLCGQISRAAAWEDREYPDRARAEHWSRERVFELLERLPELRRELEADVRAAFRADPAAESVHDVVFSYPGIIALTAYRLAHVLYAADVPMIPRILTEHAHGLTGIDIHPGARIGRAFFIDHGTGVVIGATARIGDEVRLYQGVTLGALSVRGDAERSRSGVVKRHPTLEDRVTVYAGATILGGDTVVGADSVIGANVWLTRSVPARSRILFRPPESFDPISPPGDTDP